MALTARREKFAQECASGKNLTDAYRASFSATKMADRTLWSRASQMAAIGEVSARIAELKLAITNKATELFSKTHAEIKALVLQDAWEVATADASELITHRRLNCRHCHGRNNAYRWRDESEFWQALSEASDKQAEWDEKPPERRSRKRPELPTDEGGYGFRRLAPPALSCPKCEGEGIEDTRVADIRTIGGPARRLFAGVKVKKDGSREVVMRDKDAARMLLAKHVGMIDDRVQHTGAVGLFPMTITDAERAEILKLIEKDI